MKNLKNEILKTMATKVRSSKGWTILFALVLAVGMLTPHPVAAQGAACSPGTQPVTLVASINGGGRAVMEPPYFGSGMPTEFGAGVKLYSDCTATGEFLCLDQPPSPGMVWGKVTGWSVVGGLIRLNVVGKYIPVGNFFPPPGGHPVPQDFTVTIQQYGGAGVGHWTLEFGGEIACSELLTSGQIRIRYAN